MDEKEFMRVALSLAAKGRTSPNPKVGCVVVKNGKIIGKGFHKKAGMPHAEIEAIQDAQNRKQETRNATLYLTLEPCCSTYPGKRTPPCTETVLNSGVSRLVVAMKDPNPKVSGRGIEFLRKNGVKVEVGLFGEEAKEINLPYIKHITKRVPFVAIKMAMSADGKIATRKGESKWISGEESRKLVHGMRSEFDAVMVGANTVRTDDPRLTTRGIKEGRNPIRIIVDSNLDVNTKSNFMKDADKAKVIIATTETASKQKIKNFESLGARVLVCGKKNGEVELNGLMRELGKLDVQSVLLEGGSELNASAIEAGIVDKIYFFIAPKIIGGRDAKGPVGGMGIGRMGQALKLKNVKMEKVGEDWMMSAEL